MPRLALPRVCVDCQSVEISGRIAALLAEETAAGGRLAQQVESCAIEQADVILTDRALGERASQDSTEEVAVLGIGTSDAVDAELPLDCTARELRLAIGLAARLTATRRERDAVARARDRSELLAETDPLTGLPNRRVWERRIAALRTSDEQSAWIALVDLDNFKALNDRLGMTAGDQVLARAARALADALRREDLVARIGGDEFGLLVTGADDRQIQQVLGRVQNAVRAGGEVTASLGYCRYEGADLGSSLSVAEVALRNAKLSGGNCISPSELK